MVFNSFRNKLLFIKIIKSESDDRSPFTLSLSIIVKCKRINNSWLGSKVEDVDCFHRLDAGSIQTVMPGGSLVTSDAPLFG